MYILYYGLAAFAGGIVSALLGWIGSDPPEPFIGRKFAASALKAFLAAVAAISAGAIIPPVGLLATILLCAGAFLAGAGVDSALKRLVNAATAQEK